VPGAVNLDSQNRWLRSSIPVLGRSGQLRMSAMFIIHPSKRNHLKPQRGGMGLPDTAPGAPTELGRVAAQGLAFGEPHQLRKAVKMSQTLGLWR
jgi:hypothetical protein